MYGNKSLYWHPLITASPFISKRRYRYLVSRSGLLLIRHPSIHTYRVVSCDSRAVRVGSWKDWKDVKPACVELTAGGWTARSASAL